jgi:hypothetical protein
LKKLLVAPLGPVVQIPVALELRPQDLLALARPLQFAEESAGAQLPLALAADLEIGVRSQGEAPQNLRELLRSLPLDERPAQVAAGT